MKEISIKICCLLAASLVAGAALLLVSILIQISTNGAFPTYHDFMFALTITLVYSPIVGIVFGLPILVVIQRLVPLKDAFTVYVLIGSIIGGGVEFLIAYDKLIPTKGLLAGAVGGACLWWFLQVSERISHRPRPKI